MGVIAIIYLIVRANQTWLRTFDAGIAFTPDGQSLVVTTANSEPNVFLWDLSRPDDQPSQLSGHRDSWVGAAAVSPDGKLLATGDQGAGCSLGRV